MDWLALIGRAEAAKREVPNGKFVIAPAETHQSKELFDVVFISGLSIYLADEQAAKLMANVSSLVKPS